MLAEVEEIVIEEEEKEISSLNHSFICAGTMEQLYENKKIKVLPELTLDVDKGITPDISIYTRAKVQPNFRRDITYYTEMPILAIEFISAS